MFMEHLCRAIPGPVKIKLLRLKHPELPTRIPDMQLLIASKGIEITDLKRSASLARIRKSPMLLDPDKFFPYFFVKFPFNPELLTHGVTSELENAINIFSASSSLSQLTPELKMGLLSALSPCMHCESIVSCSRSIISFFQRTDPLKPDYISIGHQDV